MSQWKNIASVAALAIAAALGGTGCLAQQGADEGTTNDPTIAADQPAQNEATATQEKTGAATEACGGGFWGGWGGWGGFGGCAGFGGCGGFGGCAGFGGCGGIGFAGCGGIGFAGCGLAGYGCLPGGYFGGFPPFAGGCGCF